MDDLSGWHNAQRRFSQPDAGRFKELTHLTVPKIDLFGKEMEEYESVKTWKNSLRPASVDSWRRQKCDLRDYCLWREMDPDAVLAERKANRAKDSEARLEEIALQKYRQYILDRGLSQGSGQKAFVSIVSFFKHNYQRLVFATFPSLTMDQYKGAKRLKKEEVQHLYSFANGFREKLVILAGAESGLRLRALCALRLSTLVAIEDGSKEGVLCQSIEDLAGVTIPCRVSLPTRFYTSRRKREGITFVCKDFVKLLKQNLEERRKAGEPIGGDTPIFPTYKVKVRVLSTGMVVIRHQDSWVSPGNKIMVSVAIGEGGTRLIDAEVLDIKCDPLGDEGIEGVLRRLRKKAGLTFDAESERPASPHSLRKYLHSTLDASGVNSVMVNVIIGHSNAIADHYSGRRNLDIEEIRHAYESAMYRIALTEDSNGVKVKQLEKEQKMFQFQTAEAISQLLQNQQALFNMLATTKGADPLQIEELRKLGGQSSKLLQRIKQQQLPGA